MDDDIEFFSSCILKGLGYDTSIMVVAELDEELEDDEDDEELDEPDEDEASLMRGFLTSLVLPWHLKANLSSATISSHQLVPRSSDCCLVPMKNSQMARPLDTGKRQQDLHKQ